MASAPPGGLAVAAPGGAADADGDEIPDGSDACPLRPGLPPDGCPPADVDGDRVLDRRDRCPDTPGPIANGGCPDTDRDADGVVDRVDRCPDAYGRPDHAGCEAPDRDGDGIEDAADRCPGRPETWNGRRDRDGCPDRGAALALAQGKRLVIPARRVFRSGGALATRGRRAADVAASWLQARRARRVAVLVPAPGGAGGQAALQARAWAVIARVASASGLPPAAFTAAPAGSSPALALPGGGARGRQAAAIVFETP